MKLGTETGSLVNHLQARETIGAPEPVVGMAVTMLGWSDRHAGTIVAIEKGRIFVNRDKATRVDSNGMSESQSYTFETDENGARYVFKRDRSGQWREVTLSDSGRWVYAGGMGLKIGVRGEYHDFSF